MSTLQKCPAGHVGPVRYDNRGNRRCTFCWERVVSDPFEGVTPEEQAAPAPVAQAEEPEAAPAPAPVKPAKKKGK